MEFLIPAFMRVQRGLTTAPKVTSLLEDLANNGDANLTHRDRLAILGLPDDDIVASNITSVSGLSRSDFIKRAAESPELLTKPELNLLVDRYWLGITGPEDKVRANTSDELTLISPEHNEAVREQLRLIREPIYDDIREDQALEGAGVELKRRSDVARSLRDEERLRATLASFNGPDWARNYLKKKVRNLGVSLNISTHS